MDPIAGTLEKLKDGDSAVSPRKMFIDMIGADAIVGCAFLKASMCFGSKKPGKALAMLLRVTMPRIGTIGVWDVILTYDLLFVTPVQTTTVLRNVVMH